MTASYHRDGGFALLEAVAALFLGALIFSSMLLAGDMVARRLDSAFRKTDQLEALETGLAALRRDLRSALPVHAGDEDHAPVLFSGTETSLSFVTGPSGAGRRLDEQALRIEARPEGLIRWSAAFLPNARDFEAVRGGRPEMLIAGPWSYRFAYAESLHPTQAWQSQWSAADELPKLIRLQVVERSEPRRTLLSLEVAPWVNAAFPKPDDAETQTKDADLEDESLQFVERGHTNE